MNSLRASNGLPALIEDSILDSTAYSTAYQMAANGGCAHIGGARERIAAAGFGGGATIFATENMACATSATIGDIQSWWSDAVHMYPMTGASYTHVGAGVYTASSGTTYYVLHAAYISGSPGSYNPQPPAEEEPVIQQVQPVFIVTPQEDGSIVHTVLYGQTLFTIAAWYGVTVTEIQKLNNLSGEAIYEGQKLTIRLAPTATITPTRTVTPRQPTRTPTMTPSPTRQVTPPTPTPTQKPSLASVLPPLDRQWLGFGLLIISAVGLMAVVYSSFLKPLRKK